MSDTRPKKSRKEWDRKYTQNNKEKINKYKEENKEKIAKYKVDYHNRNKDKIYRRKRDWNRALKIKVLTYYSIFTTKPMCAIPGCLISDPDMLCLDHIDNDGAKHRKEINKTNIYPWIIKNNYPPGFQVICHNHNFKKELLSHCKF